MSVHEQRTPNRFITVTPVSLVSHHCEYDVRVRPPRMDTRRTARNPIEGGGKDRRDLVTSGSVILRVTR